MLRGAFGHALRRGAPERVYRELFEPVIEGEPPPFLKGVTTAPRPYVFVPDPAEHTKRDYATADPLRFELVLIGQAADLHHVVVPCLESMAETGLGKRRHRFHLQRIECPDGEGGWETGYERDVLEWQGDAPLLRPVSWLPDPQAGVSLDFLTPTSLTSKGDPLESFRFRELAFRMLRRSLELAHFHVPEAEVDWHFKPLLVKASDITITHRDLRREDLDRWSNRQRRKVPLGGFVGTLRLEGDLEPFAPLLRTAEVVHVGKGTTMGLGMVRVGGGEP